MRHTCMAELNNVGCYIAHDAYVPNEQFHLCDQPAIDAIDFVGTTIWLCAEHFDVFAPSYPAAF